MKIKRRQIVTRYDKTKGKTKIEKIQRATEAKIAKNKLGNPQFKKSSFDIRE